MGVYGVLAYSVTQRRHELGIRMAMGADRRTVTRMVLRTGALLCGAGILIGLAGAFGLARLMGSLLFEVDPYDLTSFMSAPSNFDSLRPTTANYSGRDAKPHRRRRRDSL